GADELVAALDRHHAYLQASGQLAERRRRRLAARTRAVLERSVQRWVAETTVLVLVPESGDGIQTLKAGVMEIADLYVVNKSDRPGGDKLRQEVEVMLGLRRGNAFRHVAPHHAAQPRTEARPDEWEPPVLATVASQGTGVDELAAALDRHSLYLQTTGKLADRRRQRLAARTRAVLERSVQRWVVEATHAEDLLARRLDDVTAGRRSPYDVAAEILEQMKVATPR
ncbi:MAG TPA: hypothetical protein VFI66_06035, partial [Gemmatimonadales bacterium]|nr:hypothetical protein [Gemmatimonadales bacterium]